MKYHEPVLLKETLEFLNIEKGKRYIDCTLGDGGHTVAILKNGGTVLGLDYDEGSLKRATERIQSEGLYKNFVGILGNFKDIDSLAVANGFENVDGILYDLGYSSFHLEESGKGLSFQKNDPLDMRLDKSLGISAADLVNMLSAKQLEKLFLEYGEERMAKRFSEAIVRHRELKKIQTTKDLADLLVDEASPGYERGRIHPATRVFQALRIIVNDEIENLKNSLPRAARLLKLPGGRMIVISFHSLEDRVVKEFGHKVRPLITSLTKKPIVPTLKEVDSNRKARSAKMRAFEKKT